MANIEDEDYHFYGTPLEDEQQSRASTYRRPVKDPGQVRTLPIWKQEATDEQGRKRFHGAFTGGYSAGYKNTVGSAEGFQPTSFKSSRSSRHTLVQQSVDDFLDEDEKEERDRTVLTVKDDYDTFGTSAADAARNSALREAQQRPSLIPGPIIEELVVPVANGVGMRLLQKLGWRPGRGVGTAAPSRQAEETGSKWGTVAGVTLENTPLYVLEPKEGLHGLGYDPFAGAEEFRQAAAKRRKMAERAGSGGGAGGAATGSTAAGQGRGRIAFGTGVCEDTDTFGYMEDYVDQEYDGPHLLKAGPSAAGGKGSKVSTGAAIGALCVVGGNVASRAAAGVNVARNWERLALSYEVVSEGDSDDDRGGRAGLGRRRAPLLLESSSKNGPPPLLQARGHGRAPDSLIPGFLPSRSSSVSGVVVSDYFPAPEVPPEFTGHHVFPPGMQAGGLRAAFAVSATRGASGSAPPQLDGAAPAAVASGSAAPPPPPPEVPPPSDPELRKEIEVLAAIVARSGPALESIARKQAIAAVSAIAAAGEGGARAAACDADEKVAGAGVRSKYSFFVTGKGLPYYLWRLHRIQTALTAVNAGTQQHMLPSATGAATAPPGGLSSATSLTGSVAQRPAGGRPETLTVEQRMAMLGEQPLPVSAATGAAAAVAAAGGSTASAVASRPQPQVAEADRKHLQAQLSSNFVRGETQDFATESTPDTIPMGLRLGSKQAAAAAAAAAAFLSRFTGGSSSETAVLQPDGAGGLQQQQKGGKDGNGGKDIDSAGRLRQEPVRSTEDWRPEPLLCKRFNVPDPYKGKAAPEQVSRFRTDLLALPETSNLVISPTAATASLTAGAPEPFQQQVTVAAAVGVLPPPPPPPPAGRVGEGTGTGLGMLAIAAPTAPHGGYGSQHPTPSPHGGHHLPPRGPTLPGPPPRLPWGLHPPPQVLAPTEALKPSNPSAEDAASVFLSTFGQSLLAPAGVGAGGDAGAPVLPLPPPQGSLVLTARPSNDRHAQPPLPAAQGSSPITETLLKDAAPGQAMQPQPPQAPQNEEIVVMPLDKPLDLFAAIFEAESDEEEEVEEELGMAAATQVANQSGDGAVQDERPGQVTATVAGGGPAGPAKSLAEALMRAQEVSSKRAQEARESRQTEALQEQLLAGGKQVAQASGFGGCGAEVAARGSAGAVGGIMGPVDPEVQERIRAALSVFQRHHSGKDRNKERKRKKKGKDKQKDRKGKKDKKRKDKDREPDGDRGGKRSRKERRKDEKEEKEEKKRKREKEQRRERKSSKRRRRERDGSDDDEERGRRRAREAGGDQSRGRERERKRGRSRNSSGSSREDERIGFVRRHDGSREEPSGAYELLVDPTAAAAGGRASGSGAGAERGLQGSGGGFVGGPVSSSDTGTDSSSREDSSTSSESGSDNEAECR